jgi:hypothetical protein
MLKIDLVQLKLSDETYDTIRLSGVFSALRDAGPDYWGRRVIESIPEKPCAEKSTICWHRPTTAPARLASDWARNRPRRAAHSTKRLPLDGRQIGNACGICGGSGEQGELSSIRRSARRKSIGSRAHLPVARRNHLG